jgi:tetratricopeptide (TPR) repeat protein
MKTLMAVLLLVAMCGSAFAAERSFDSLANAQKAAAKSNRGIFVICYAVVPGDSTNAQIQFTAAINEDEAIAKLADNFELAIVNCFSLAHAKDNQCVDPALAKAYGWPCTVSLYAPGAVKHMWRKEMSHDDINGRKEHSKADIQATLKEAADIYVDFNKTLADLDAKVKENKDLKADIDTQLAYAEAWAKALVAPKARAYFAEAIKLIKKADKEDTRIESLTLRAAEVEYAGGAYAEAEKAFNGFAKAFKDSDKAWHAKVMAAKALAMGGDTDAGKAALEKLVKDKKTPTETKTEAEEAIKEINSEAK